MNDYLLKSVCVARTAYKFFAREKNANYSWVIYHFISVSMNWLILLSHCALQFLQLLKGPALPKTSQPLSHRRSAWSAEWKECPSPPFSGTKTGSKCQYFTSALRHERLNKLILKIFFYFQTRVSWRPQPGSVRQGSSAEDKKCPSWGQGSLPVQCHEHGWQTIQRL